MNPKFPDKAKGKARTVLKCKWCHNRRDRPHLQICKRSPDEKHEFVKVIVP